MKLILLLLVVCLGVWWWRRGRDAAVNAAPAARAPAPSAVLPHEEMPACAECGLHLPRSEGVLSEDGRLFFCGLAHRRSHELAQARAQAPDRP